MKGRKPKPTNLHILNGNPSRKKLNTKEPKPRPLSPSCPKWLRREAKKEWKRIAPQLERIGLLTEIDGTALAGYCQSYAKWKEAEEYISKNGFAYNIPKRDEEGEIISLYVAQWPQVSIAKQCLDQIKAFCAEFGMTPSSRSRMEVNVPKEEDDGMRSFLSGLD
jgi:P27 family predicted phage terminase small subunit